MNWKLGLYRGHVGMYRDHIRCRGHRLFRNSMQNSGIACSCFGCGAIMLPTVGTQADISWPQTTPTQQKLHEVTKKHTNEAFARAYDQVP